jgi:hypothetical protein
VITKKKRDFFPKKELQDQLDQLQLSGQRLHYEKEIPLTPQDIQSIKRLFRKVAAFFIVLSIPLVIVIYLFQREVGVIVVCGAILLSFLLVIIRAAIVLGTKLKVGKKTLARGIVTDRYTRKEYGERDEDGKRSEQVVNYLVVGDHEFRVDNSIYKVYKIGDAIELHFMVNNKNQPYFLYHQKLKVAGLRL